MLGHLTRARKLATAPGAVLPFTLWLSRGAQLAAFLIGGATILARVVTGPLWGFSAAWYSAIDSLTTLTTGGMILLMGATLWAESHTAKHKPAAEAVDVH